MKSPAMIVESEDSSSTFRVIGVEMRLPTAIHRRGVRLRLLRPPHSLPVVIVGTRRGSPALGAGHAPARFGEPNWLARGLSARGDE